MPRPIFLESQTEEVGESLTECLAAADTVLGLLVDLTSRGIDLFRDALLEKERFSGTLVVALSPACPTREEDLRQLLNLCDEFQGDHFSLQLRLLPLPSGVTQEARHAVSPPSSMMLRASGTNQCWIWFGSNGDLDAHRDYHTASLNLLFSASPTPD